MSAPVKSEPPRPRVVVMPAWLVAMKPPITGTWPSAISGSSWDLGALLDERVLGNGLLEVGVGDDDLAGVDLNGMHAQMGEGGGDDTARQALAVADDQIADARGKFEDGRQAAQDFVEGVEFLVNKFDQLGGVGNKLGGGFTMAPAQLITDGDGSVTVALFTGGGGAQQRIGNLGHGADDDHRLLAQGDAPGDDGRGAADGGGVFDRGAAEFHDYQAHLYFLV